MQHQKEVMQGLIYGICIGGIIVTMAIVALQIYAYGLHKKWITDGTKQKRKEDSSHQQQTAGHVPWYHRGF
jgi:hypothetical protein